MKAVYPGTFDPITNGHLDLIKRASDIFSDLTIAVACDNNSKNTLFTSDERVQMLRQTLKEFSIQAEVVNFNGLLIEFVQNLSAKVIIRGVRAFSDFEYEFQMASINYRMDSSIQTFFLPSRDDMHFISSKMIKSVASIGGNVSSFVPANVEKILIEKFKNLNKIS
jgi:pantetheine-phosphate adenylyltransferase